jgi:DNA-binding GntR family transcriptional regulator
MPSHPLRQIFGDQGKRFAKAPPYRQSAYNAIKEAILAGELGTNQPLVEEQIAASLNISRTPVREALAILQHERYIGPRNGRGLYVRTLTRTEFIEMFVANEVIEPYLARRAALLASDDQRNAIQIAIYLGRGAAEGGDIAGFLRASRDFHRRMGEAAGNLILTDFVVGNEERTDMYLLTTGKMLDTDKMMASLREHDAIYEALVQGDPEAAERSVIYHAQSLRERFADLFSGPEERE